MAGTNGKQTPITIKKYANRRLYNTATSSYVTLDHLSQMVREQKDFVVYDAKTGEDITRAVLTQIIVEEESKSGQHLLPTSFLRQLISFYGDSLGGIVPNYLEYSMQAFARNEEQIRGMMQSTLDGLFPVNQFEEMSRQNMALFESAMKMFSPFPEEEGGGGERPASRTGEVPRSPAEDPRLKDLRDRLSEMQSQLDDLARKSSK